MNILVINLPHRRDRLDTFMKHWEWLGHIDIVDGVLSDTLHTGCGLAHINAIRKGLSNAHWCLVLEDDARLNCSRSDFLNAVNEAAKQCTEWDVVMLGPNSHRIFHAPTEIYQVSPNFIKVSCTKSIRSCTGMLWSKNSIPLIQEYSRLLGYVLAILGMKHQMLFQFIHCQIYGLVQEFLYSKNQVFFQIIRMLRLMIS